MPLHLQHRRNYNIRDYISQELFICGIIPYLYVRPCGRGAGIVKKRKEILRIRGGLRDLGGYLVKIG